MNRFKVLNSGFALIVGIAFLCAALIAQSNVVVAIAFFMVVLTASLSIFIQKMAYYLNEKCLVKDYEEYLKKGIKLKTKKYQFLLMMCLAHQRKVDELKALMMKIKSMKLTDDEKLYIRINELLLDEDVEQLEKLYSDATFTTPKYQYMKETLKARIHILKDEYEQALSIFESFPKGPTISEVAFAYHKGLCCYKLGKTNKMNTYKEFILNHCGQTIYGELTKQWQS